MANVGYDLEREVWDMHVSGEVRAALGELREEERSPIVLAYFGGYTYREVAGMLEEPEGTVKSRIRVRAAAAARRAGRTQGSGAMSASDHEAIEELLGAYALDAVDADEREAVEEHLAVSPVRGRGAATTWRWPACSAASARSPPDGPVGPHRLVPRRRPPAVAPFPLERARDRGDRRGRMLAGGLGVAAALVVGLLTWQVVEQQDQIDTLDEDLGAR